MGYIYLITNKINQKKYVGQTSYSIEERFNQHIKVSLKYKERPLYRAFNKYGISNFIIEQIEECPNSDLIKREQYWINKLDTFHNGYNATLGGEGTIIYNHDEILETLKNNIFLSDLVDKFHCDPKTIRKIAQANNIQLKSKVNVQHQIAVQCLNKNDYSLVKEFSSMTEAAQWLISEGYSKTNISDYKNIRGKISQASRGIRKTAYGFIWKIL